MEEIEVGKVYRHYKGKYYYVIDIGVHSENLKQCVIYKALYDDYKTWVRPLKEFLDPIDVNNPENIAKQKHRFERIDLNDRH